MNIRLNHKFKLNNRGNTLGIVLIGIFILSILGTLILSLTATNYKMKLVDKKSESTFYYAEKAIDEIYAGIGTEVMTCAKESYENVMKNYIYEEAGTGTTKKLTADEAEELFYQTYTDGKDNGGVSVIQGLKDLYPDSSVADNINAIFSRFEAKGYITSVSGYSFKLVSLTSGTDLTKVRYNYDMGTGKLKEVLLENVCVVCETDSTGFYSSIVTDFKIKVPDVSLNFKDSPDEYNFDELFEYSIVAQGESTTNNAIEIDAANTTITGNVYAGTSGNNKSILLGKNLLERNLTINAKNLVCEGSFVVNGSKAELGNLDGTDTTDSTDTLQFYAKDIILEGTASGNAEDLDLNITGNCIIADDLEVNGDNYDLKITGNYFGYGFQAKAGDPTVEADSGTFSGFVTPASDVHEHEQRSAIIINGVNANLDMTGVNQMILAGRAYIDLDSGGQYRNASYMTGESVSFKGNQQIYMADTALANSAVQGKNPIPYTEFTSLFSTASGYTDGDELSVSHYSDLGLDSDLVVAKKTNTNVYFYNKQNNPEAQTAYFINTYYDNAVKAESMRTHVKDTLKVRNLSFGTNLQAYTVGAMMSVSNGNLNVLGYGSYGNGGGISKTDFDALIADILVRKSYLSHTFKDVGAETVLGVGSYLSGVPASTETATPYDYFIDTVIIDGYTGRTEGQNLQRSDGNTAIREFLKSTFGYTNAELDANVINVGYIIDNSGGSGTYEVVFDAGIVITNKPITISKNFMGLIVCKDCVYISGGDVKIEANKELVKCLYENVPDLTALLKVSISEADLEEDVVSGDSLQFEDLVEKYNWRKNVQ